MVTPGTRGTTDSPVQAKSAWLLGVEWARLGSNQRPLACEAGVLDGEDAIGH
jgi:hypothetical protein